MKNLLALLALLGVVALSGRSQEKTTEPSTGKTFLNEVTFSQNGKQYALQLTGVTVRKKLVFKVYGMAHYVQDPVKGSREDIFRNVLAEGKAKQIVMDFVREVGVEKIQDAYRDGFKENSSPEDLKKIQPLVDQFIGYFTKDVKENDEFMLRWLPGGIVIATVQGEEKPAITSELFARTLWSIWFSKQSIVDRDDLVSRVAAD